LAGCGGGGDSGSGGSGAADAEGVYGGTINNGASRDFQAIVLDDGSFWVMYGNLVSGTFQIAGFMQGAGTFGNGSFSAPGLRDYAIYPAVSGTASGTYNATAKTISGSAVLLGRTVSFSGGPIVGSTYSYGTPAALSSVAGSWSVRLSTNESATLTVSTTGAVTIQSSGGCRSSGTVKPRASGKNVFDVAVTFGGPPCLLPTTAVSGIAAVYPLANGRTQLLAAARDGAQTAGFLAAGIR
jgi:hypothetical protein